MNRPLPVVIVQQQISELLQAYPELVEDEVLRTDMIEGSTQAFEFLSQVTQRIQGAAATATGIKLLIADLRERADRMERREEALRGLAFKVMQTAQIHKAELPEATLSIRQGARKVVVVNEAEIPKSCQRIKVEPDKVKIKTLLQSGEDVPGCVLSNAEPVLAIRVK